MGYLRQWDLPLGLGPGGNAAFPFLFCVCVCRGVELGVQRVPRLGATSSQALSSPSACPVCTSCILSLWRGTGLPWPGPAGPLTWRPGQWAAGWGPFLSGWEGGLRARQRTTLLWPAGAQRGAREAFFTSSEGRRGLAFMADCADPLSRRWDHRQTDRQGRDQCVSGVVFLGLFLLFI